MMQNQNNIKKCLGKLWRLPVTLLLMIALSVPAFAGTRISKPGKDTGSNDIYYKGLVSYYNTSSQPWKNMKSGSLLYAYQGKKDAKYYVPVHYYSNNWFYNNKEKVTIDFKGTYSNSVTNTVSETLGVNVSSSMVKLASSLSSSFSTSCTVTSSYSTSYTFVMSKYSTRYKYKVAAFGNLIKYGVVKRNRLTGRTSSAGAAYTYDQKAGADLRLAYKRK